jgi:hypothetical protein
MTNGDGELILPKEYDYKIKDGSIVMVNIQYDCVNLVT